MISKHYIFSKSCIAIFLCFLIINFVHAHSFVHARVSDIEKEIQKEQKNLEDVKDSMTSAEQKIEESKSRKETLLGELATTKSNIHRLESEIDAVNKDISETMDKISLTQKELETSEKELEEQDKIIKARLRAMHENGNIGYLEVLFDSNSFSDFLTRFHYLQAILKEDVKILSFIQELKQRIELQEQELEEQKHSLIESKQAKVDKHDEIKKRSQEKTRLLEAVRAEIKEQERVIEELEEQSSQIETIIEKRQQEKREAKRELTAQVDGELTWPLPAYGTNMITSGFGYRTHPITGREGSFHGGIDIGIPRSSWPASPNYNGNPVDIVAAEQGVVIFTGIQGSLNYGYGRVVIIDHGGNITTVYAHAHEILVNEGQRVFAGQPIAIVGSTGSSTGPHVHFEVRESGKRVNPMNYFH